MSECNALRESMPLLLTESLDPVRRELTHQHIEGCDDCSAEWNAYRDAWRKMDDLPEVVVPARARARFLATIGGAAGSQPAEETAGGLRARRSTEGDNVVPFQRRPAFKWIAQAAAVAVLVGGGYFAGVKRPVEVAPQKVTIDTVTPKPLAIAETRVMDANALAP